MSFAYSLDLQPKRSSPLAQKAWTATDLPVVTETNTSKSSTDEVEHAHERLRAWLDEEDAEILLGAQSNSNRQQRKTKRQRQRQKAKKGRSLGRVKDQQIEAGVFKFEDRDKTTSKRRKRSVSSVSGSAEPDDAAGRSAVDEGREIEQESQRNIDALFGGGLDTPFRSYTSEPAVEDDVAADEDDIDAMNVPGSGKKRSLSASEAVERSRKRYRHDFYSN